MAEAELITCWLPESIPSLPDECTRGDDVASAEPSDHELRASPRSATALPLTFIAEASELTCWLPDSIPSLPCERTDGDEVAVADPSDPLLDASPNTARALPLQFVADAVLVTCWFPERRPSLPDEWTRGDEVASAQPSEWWLEASPKSATALPLTFIASASDETCWLPEPIPSLPDEATRGDDVASAEPVESSLVASPNTARALPLQFVAVAELVTCWLPDRRPSLPDEWTRGDDVASAEPVESSLVASPKTATALPLTFVASASDETCWLPESIPSLPDERTCGDDVASAEPVESSLVASPNTETALPLQLVAVAELVTCWLPDRRPSPPDDSTSGDDVASAEPVEPSLSALPNTEIALPLMFHAPAVLQACWLPKSSQPMNDATQSDSPEDETDGDDVAVADPTEPMLFASPNTEIAFPLKFQASAELPTCWFPESIPPPPEELAEGDDVAVADPVELMLFASPKTEIALPLKFHALAELPTCWLPDSVPPAPEELAEGDDVAVADPVELMLFASPKMEIALPLMFHAVAELPTCWLPDRRPPPPLPDELAVGDDVAVADPVESMLFASPNTEIAMPLMLQAPVELSIRILPPVSRPPLQSDSQGIDVAVADPVDPTEIASPKTEMALPLKLHA
ncbi:hypothetical protein [Agrococcus carbonis]|uniref:hypothetical protein n=1 Tax=Agrococcus carbonis TaxID=684552 RepID=UPI0012FC58E9|nr:hypothetical protein [Agrococcus carbonis]